LEKLQDRLPPFPTDKALAVIESDYGRPAKAIFKSISPEPVAAASLGQVYRGMLYDGSEVAIKVQRPGVAASISLDVLVLRRLAKQVRAWRKLNTDLPALIDEWAASLFKELDYRQEARNGIKFKELYDHLEGVYVPKMYSDLTTRRVLVMEWIDGERLRTGYSSSSAPSEGPVAGSGRNPADDLRLVEVGVKCSLEQLLEYGFYHADPHPGNLVRTRDGKLAYLDFGMMGEVNERIRRGLIQATLHLVNREYEALADDFITLGMLPEDSNKELIVPALTSVFAKALSGGVSNLSFGDLSANLGRTMYEFKFQIPSYYTLLVRSLSVLEGIALASDPKYKVLNAAYPWVARRLLTDQSPELQSTLLSLIYRDGKLNFKRMESLFTEATQSTGLPQRPKGSPSGTPPPRGDALALILSPQGEFVRGIVVEELAKGADAAWRVAIDSAVFSAYGEIHAAMQNTPGIAQAPMFRNVLDFLSSVPPLSDTDDKEQLEGLWKLASTLQEASIAQSEREKGAGPSREKKEKVHSSFTASSPLEKLESLFEFTQWAVNETQTLTPEERKQALLLPFEVGQTASTRFIARALRYIFADSEGKAGDVPSEGSDASESHLKRPTFTTNAVSSSAKGPMYVQKRFLFQDKSLDLGQAGTLFHPRVFGTSRSPSGHALLNANARSRV
jgi:aarF domain-containing kinase